MGRDHDLESYTHDLELAQQREIVHTNESKREHFRPRTVASKLALSGLSAPLRALCSTPRSQRRLAL